MRYRPFHGTTLLPIPASMLILSNLTYRPPFSRKSTARYSSLQNTSLSSPQLVSHSTSALVLTLLIEGGSIHWLLKKSLWPETKLRNRCDSLSEVTHLCSMFHHNRTQVLHSRTQVLHSRTQVPLLRQSHRTLSTRSAPQNHRPLSAPR
jgi:hypothetical protein